MNRRSFIHGVASLLGLSVVVRSDELTKHTPQLTEGSAKNGPYCVEIVKPSLWSERGLPFFDTLQQAQNFAIARMNIMRNMGETSGKIFVTTPSGTQIQTCTWNEYHSTIVAYVDGKGNFYSV